MLDDDGVALRTCGAGVAVALDGARVMTTSARFRFGAGVGAGVREAVGVGRAGVLLFVSGGFLDDEDEEEAEKSLKSIGRGLGVTELEDATAAEVVASVGL